VALRKACCDIRKMEPLERALAGKKAWITGLRREQSGARAEVRRHRTPEGAGGRRTVDRVKLNPLAAGPGATCGTTSPCTSVDYNPLHDQFFPSIGCAPCTRAVSWARTFALGPLVVGRRKRQGMRAARRQVHRDPDP
jgi:phosphoadenosine phosphosulfate reductase